MAAAQQPWRPSLPILLQPPGLTAFRRLAGREVLPMITVDQFMDIKNRHTNGQSIGSIVQDTGLSKNTVRDVVRGKHPIETNKQPKARKRKSSKLDSFKEYIRNRVEAFDLSAVRLLEEIKSMGYEGEIHTIRRFIKTLKHDWTRLKSATVRFETPPGKQAQCDWGHVGRCPGANGKPIEVYVFVMVLGYSRQTFIRFTTSMKIPVLIECHKLAFEYFQGIPQSILYDNMSQVRKGPGKLNPQFDDFASHFGFEVKTHRPYRPRTKGKVERTVDYIKKNFLNGQDFKGLEDLNSRSLKWLNETANVRIHGTTGEKPVDLWQQEKDQLLSLVNVNPYVPTLRFDRKVGSASCVLYRQSHYSVPPKCTGETVVVLVQGSSIWNNLGFGLLIVKLCPAQFYWSHAIDLWYNTNGLRIPQEIILAEEI